MLFLSKNQSRLHWTPILHGTGSLNSTAPALASALSVACSGPTLEGSKNAFFLPCIYGKHTVAKCRGLLELHSLS